MTTASKKFLDRINRIDRINSSLSGRKGEKCITFGKESRVYAKKIADVLSRTRKGCGPPVREPGLVFSIYKGNWKQKRNPLDPINPVKIIMEHEHLTHKIIACAYKVYNTLGFGFLESVYKKAMVIELTQNTLRVEEEKPLKVHYANQVIGDFYVDLVVEEEIIIELKSVEKLIKAHEVQLVNYLTALRKDVGLLINFGPEGVQVKRKYRKSIGQDKRD